jgi:cytochrome c
MKQIMALVAIAALAVPFGAQAQDAKAGEGVIKGSGCLKCHSVSADKDGPSYKSVAAKYKGQADAQAKLEKFVSGHHGGPKPKDKAKDAVAYILSR